MDEETKGNLMEERRWYQPLRVIGWFVLAVAALHDLRLVYEQTLLTWKDGPQMVGSRAASTWCAWLPWLFLLDCEFSIFCAPESSHTWRPSCGRSLAASFSSSSGCSDSLDSLQCVEGHHY